MTEHWRDIYQLGIIVGAVLVGIPFTLAWVRMMKRYWQGEMNREEIRNQDEDGDANASK